MADEEEWRRILADRTSPLARVVKAVTAGETAMAGAPETAIGLSSNVTIDLLGLFLRREALLAGLKARIVQGGYDDPIGDMERFAAESVEHVFLLPVLDNILPSFEPQLSILPADIVEAKHAELRARWRLVFDRARGFRSLHVGLYHRFGRAAATDGNDAVAEAIERLNAAMRDAAAGASNVRFVDVGAIVTDLGRAAAFDPRFYFQAKALYSPGLLSALARRIAEATRGFGTYFYKALALDCDNTLWGGVIGEDLLEGIRLDPHDAPGNVFWRVQQALAGLEREGLLLCLCTKNNPADVEEVFRHHPHMVLKEEQIVARRVNWQDKVSNLQSLAEELNIGLDALIFLDDSAVELDSVRARLPMVRTFAVPAALAGYPAVIEEIAALYASGGVADDSRAKTEQYRARAAAVADRAAFGSHEEYLASLDLEARLRVDAPADAPRISELSLKSNQFNLTTRRYTEGEIKALMEEDDTEVISATIRNRFGDSGITGIVVMRFEGPVARIETFLMSCRVLGQGVEFALWTPIADRCRARGCTSIEADYLPTPKNAQVHDFYDRLGFGLVGDEAGARRYRTSLDTFSPPPAPWVKVYNG
jgi:FkbH-like protein